MWTPVVNGVEKVPGQAVPRKELEPDLQACAARRGLEMAQVYELPESARENESGIAIGG